MARMDLGSAVSQALRRVYNSPIRADILVNLATSAGLAPLAGTVWDELGTSSILFSVLATGLFVVAFAPERSDETAPVVTMGTRRHRAHCL